MLCHAASYVFSSCDRRPLAAWQQRRRQAPVQPRSAAVDLVLHALGHGVSMTTMPLHLEPARPAAGSMHTNRTSGATTLLRCRLFEKFNLFLPLFLVKRYAQLQLSENVVAHGQRRNQAPAVEFPNIPMIRNNEHAISLEFAGRLLGALRYLSHISIAQPTQSNGLWTALRTQYSLSIFSSPGSCSGEALVSPWRTAQRAPADP